MKLPWFKRAGIFFLPTKTAGWMVLMAAIAYCVHTFIAIDRRSNSASDTIRNFVFNFLIIGAIYSLLAFVASGQPKAR